MNAHPAPTRHDKQSVVDAAMRVLAENGLPGLSMRRIAEELDVQVSALYWHFPNKQALLAAVSERIVGAAQADAAPDAVAIATALRDRLLAHPDGAEIVSSSLALGLLDLPQHALLADAAAALGLSDAVADVAARTIVHYVIGCTFHEQQRMHAAVVGAADPSADVIPERIGESADAFGEGLAMVVAGVRAAASVAPASA